MLEAGADNQLLHAIVSATHGADTELLAAADHARGALLASAAKAVLVERLAPYDVAEGRGRVESVADLLVRTVLSHVMSPAADPARTAADLAWLTTRALAPPPDPRAGQGARRVG